MLGIARYLCVVLYSHNRFAGSCDCLRPFSACRLRAIPPYDIPVTALASANISLSTRTRSSIPLCEDAQKSYGTPHPLSTLTQTHIKWSSCILSWLVYRPPSSSSFISPTFASVRVFEFSVAVTTIVLQLMAIIWTTVLVRHGTPFMMSPVVHS